MQSSRYSLKNDTRAEVGIGTMIVFIATILVAAIAAGVLISTSQKLQAKSTQTGNEATQNVVGSLEVIGVQGLRSGTTATHLIDEIDITVRLAAGADPVDLSALVIQYNDGTNQLTLNECLTPIVDDAGDFDAEVIRGTTADCGVMVSGDLVKLKLGLAVASPGPATLFADALDGVDQNERVTLNIVPNHGSPTLYQFTVPNLGTGLIVNL